MKSDSGWMLRLTEDRAGIFRILTKHGGKGDAGSKKENRPQGLKGNQWAPKQEEKPCPGN